jgi:signal transduction histidine kinase
MKNIDSNLLDIIMHYSTRIMEQRSVDDLIVFIAEFARDIVNSDRCSIWIIDYHKHILCTKVAQGVDSLKHLEIPINSGVVGYALANKKDIILNNPYESDIFYSDIDRLTGYRTNCLLAVPIKDNSNHIIGVAQVINKKDDLNQEFTDQDIEHLKIAVSYLSGALNVLLLEEKNREKDKRLFQQSKMAEMGNMMASIIHQWKQPLNIISIQNQKLIFSYTLNKLKKEDVDSITDSTNKQIKYISQTMDVFRDFFKPNQEKVSFRLLSFFEDVKMILEKLYETQNVKLNIDVNDDNIYGYPNELKQVMINILNNSRDAILENNSLNKNIYVSSILNDSVLTIKITDFAGGIPEDIIDKIFDPYFTTKDDNTGTGIGLDMSKEIIKKANGKISVKNTKNENNEIGACFTIELPAN